MILATISTPPVVPPTKNTIPSPIPAIIPPKTEANSLSPPISILTLYTSKNFNHAVNIVIPYKVYIIVFLSSILNPIINNGILTNIVPVDTGNPKA